MRAARYLTIAALLAPLAVACDDEADADETPDAAAARIGLFSAEVDSVTFEVDYAPNAAPYTDLSLRPGNPWTLFERNAEALFEQAPRTLNIPRTLDEMQALSADDAPPGDYDVDRLLALAAAHRDRPSTERDRSFYVVFLDGYFAEDGARQTGVLGVSIGNTGVIALFKPVIDSTNAARFVEQTVLIHEFGHAVGLVDNGLAMVEPHRDDAHGAHCTNKDCVMYWQNEGVADLVAFVQRFALTTETVVFGPECLADAEAAAR
ncbi:MAG: hypothetical protein KC620_22860 [Myxococcales bacterium]|nr:hypothetical protein [Myxococcales bacterium]